MTGIGIGLGLGFSGGARRSSAYYNQLLHDQLAGIYGANLVLLTFADDAVLTSANVTSITSRVGANFVATFAGRFQRRNAGRTTELYPADAGASAKALISATAGTKSLTVLSQAPALPASATQYLISPSADGEALAISNGASVWFASGLTTKYVDGIASSAPGTGRHLYESTKNTTNYGANVSIGSKLSDGTTGFLGGWSLVIGLDIVQSAGQRTAVNAAIATYKTAMGL